MSFTNDERAICSIHGSFYSGYSACPKCTTQPPIMTPSEPAATEVEATPDTDALMALCNADKAPRCSKDAFCFVDGEIDMHDLNVLGSFFDLCKAKERESARLRAALSRLIKEAIESCDSNNLMTDEMAEALTESRAALKETP